MCPMDLHDGTCRKQDKIRLSSRASVPAAVRAMARWIEESSAPLAIFAISRFGLLVLAYFSLVLLPINDEQEFPRVYPDNLLWDGWTRWDAVWYVSIAQEGYTNLPRNEWGQADTAFFPLYPFLIRALTLVVRDPYAAGLLISNLSFLVALLLLFHLVRAQYGDQIAKRTVVLLAVYPFSFYFTAVYSESVFLLAVTAGFYFGARRQWFWAAASAALAGATRVVGILAAAGLFLLYLEQLQFRWRRIKPNILWIALAPSGLLGFMTLLTVRFGNPIQFVESQYVEGWGKGVDVFRAIALLRGLSFSALLSGSYPAMDLIHLSIFVLALATLALSWRRLSIAHAVWAVSMLFASFSLWRSMGRFAAVIFPLFIALAFLLGDSRYQIFLLFSTLLLALFTIMYTHLYWVS